MQLAETVGPAVNLVVQAVGLLTKGLEKIGGIMPVILTYLTAFAVKSLTASLATGALTKEKTKGFILDTKTLLMDKMKQASMAFTTVLTGKSTVAEIMKQNAEKNSLVFMGQTVMALAGKTAALIANTLSLGASTSATTANTVAERANTNTKKAGIITTLVSAAASFSEVLV